MLKSEYVLNNDVCLIPRLYGITVLAVQLFNKIKRKKEKKTKNMKKHVSLYFTDVMSIYLFVVKMYSFLYVLDIDATRNGNNLKLKVKSEFSLSMGLMLINHIYTIIPYCVIMKQIWNCKINALITKYSVC